MMQRDADYFSKMGADVLTVRIREHWKAAGHDVLVYQEPVTTTSGTIWCIRSNLIRGLPATQPASVRQS